MASRPKKLDWVIDMPFMVKVKYKARKGLNTSYKFRLRGTNFFLIYRMKWEWVEFRKRVSQASRPRYRSYKQGRHEYKRTRLIDVIDHEQIPTELLFYLDHLNNLNN